MKHSRPVAAAVRVAVVCVVLACAACSSGSGSSTSSTQSSVIPACVVPIAADTNSCSSQTMFQICQVPSGSVVNGDGTVTTRGGKTVQCKNACTPSEYALTCTNSALAASSLGCRILPLPTPQGTTEYCCPCGK